MQKISNMEKLAKATPTQKPKILSSPGYFNTLNGEHLVVFKGLLEDFLIDCKQVRGLTSTTIDVYADGCSRFIWWWAIHSDYGKEIGDHPKFVTVAHVKEFVAYLRTPAENRWGCSTSKATLSAGTIVAYGRVTCVFFNWLEENEHIEVSPFSNKGVKFTSKRSDTAIIIKNVPEVDIRKIFAALSRPEQLVTFTGIRDLAMVSLLLDSGIRRGELLSITLSGLDMVNMRVTVNGKTGKRIAYFSEACKKPLNDYIKRRAVEFEGNEDALWIGRDGDPIGISTFASLMQRIKTVSGVEFHAHQLRHTFALMMSSKVSAFELKELMGHKNIATTQIYVQNNPDALSKAHAPASPLTVLSEKEVVQGLRRRGRPLKNR